MPELRTIERRIYPVEYRVVAGSEGRQRWARAVTYGTVDSYGTVWAPGCFNAGLGERMPTVLYGHDWWNLDHVLGQGIDFRDVRAADEFGPPGCDVLIEFADPDLVPSARLAIALTTPPNPVLRDVSVGFDRREWLRKDDLPPDLLALGAEELMQDALMDELSSVVRGAVPGAQMRSRSWVIDGQVVVEPPEAAPEGEPAPPAASPARASGVVREDLIAVSRMMAAGEITEPEANAALELLDGRQMMTDPDEQTAALIAAIDASLDAALACAEGVDVTTWPAECQQMWAQVVAAETVVDELGELHGVPDPDDPDIGGDAAALPAAGMPMMGTAEAAPPDTRDATAALALARRR